MQRLWLHAAVLPLVLAVGACADHPSPTAARIEQSEAMASAQSAPPARGRRPGDDELLEVGRRVPGFGGVFVRDGRLHLFLRNAADHPRALQALAAVFGNVPNRANAPVVHRADYDISQLASWHQLVNAHWPEGKYVFTSVAEERNRVKIAIAAAADSPRVVGLLARIGVPRAAVVLQVTEPPRLHNGLAAMFRPTSPGYEWQVRPIGADHGTGGTLGLVFRRADNPFTDFIMVNTHSVSRPGVYDSEEAYQPMVSPDMSIGVKSWDKPFDWCPQIGAYCRQSDAAAIQLWSSGAYGAITRTAWPAIGPNAGNGSRDVVSPAWQIVGRSEYQSHYVGIQHHKVGFMTGWTAGELTDTCVDSFWNAQYGYSMYVMCQANVAAGSYPGDSGSPVFIRDPANPNGNTVLAAGLLWGGSSNYFVFSRIESFVADYGSPIKLFPGDPW